MGKNPHPVDFLGSMESRAVRTSSYLGEWFQGEMRDLHVRSMPDNTRISDYILCNILVFTLACRSKMFVQKCANT